MKLAKLLFNILFTVVGWISSMLSLYNLDTLEPTNQMLLIFVIGILCIAYIILQIHSFYKTGLNSSVHKTKEEVNKYLLDWLNKGGRTVIFTRDLTWADESIEIRKKLEEKARAGALTICLYRNTSTTDYLKGLGAEIYIHNLTENQLKSRFTIIDYGKNNPKITVGTRNNAGLFVNERYDMQTNPNACNAFIELFELVKSQQLVSSGN